VSTAISNTSSQQTVAADPSNILMHTPQHTVLMLTTLLTWLIHMACNEILHAHRFGACLLKLEILVFTGEPLDWQPFWDCFATTIDTNPTLTGVLKLSYLRAQLQGEASIYYQTSVPHECLTVVLVLSP